MKQLFALVDCNTFYASCEKIFRPDLKHKPVLVLSNNDGCIISRDNIAKSLDIPELVPFFQVEARVKQLGCQVFSSNYELYGDISARVMSLLEPYATAMEVYSIDEAFLQVQAEDYQAHGQAIKAMLWQNARMPVCVGIAPTKTLAKLANRAAKKIPRLDGVCVLDTPAKWEWLLARVPAKEVWGVGSRLSERLKALHIHSALQLAKAEQKWLRRKFSVLLERTIQELNGQPCLDLELDPAPRKAIISTRSFSYKITQLEELKQAICSYATRACEKLRAQNGLTQDIWVSLEGFDQHRGRSVRQTVKTLPHLSNDTRQIAQIGQQAITELYQPGLRYKKCGIGLMDIRTQTYEQADLFNPQQSEKSRALMSVMDNINKRYGKQTVQLAGAGLQPKWSMRRDYMSPRYTTRWSDIPVVRC